MDDMNAQLQALMRSLMQPQSPMQMQDDMVRRAQQPQPSTAMQDWKQLFSPTEVKPNYQTFAKTADGTPDLMAIKPQTTSSGMGGFMDLLGAKNLPTGLSAASKIVGK